MGEYETDLEVWERSRRAALAGLLQALDPQGVDLDAGPPCLPADPRRVPRGQDYSGLDEDDWLWLHTALAAYMAEVLIRKHGAHWRLREDSRGPNYMLVTTGYDGLENEVSPMDVVYDDFKSLPPVVMRMIATAELSAHIVPGCES